MSWLDKLTGGFRKTADRLGENVAGLGSRAALDTSTLDDIEEALIASDIGPEASKRIRNAIAARKFEQLDERGGARVGGDGLRRNERLHAARCGFDRNRRREERNTIFLVSS